MTIVKKGNYEWFKETITIDESKNDKWGTFVEKF
jgi:hypothetical protein